MRPSAAGGTIPAMPTPATGVLEPIRLRRAYRAFDPSPLEPAIEAALWGSVSLAPSAGNSQPARLVVAKSAEARAATIAALSEGNRGWAGVAPLLVAVVANPSHDMVIPNRDGTTREMWLLHVGIAVGNLLVQSTAMNLTAHPMAGFDELAVREALGIPDDVRVVTVIAIGRPGVVENLSPDLQKRETVPQTRLPIDHLVGHDRWDTRQALSYKAYREQLEPKS